MPPPTPAEIDHGVPVFLDQLQNALRFGLSMTSEIGVAALQHGHDLLLQGFTVSQVVHDYGDICQAITGGRLYARNLPGKGCVCTVDLPRATVLVLTTP